MTVKLLNIIIVICIVGIGLISVRDVVFLQKQPNKLAQNAGSTTVTISTPTAEPTRTQMTSCSNTFIGDIPFTSLQYLVKTKNTVDLDKKSTKAAELATETLSLKLENKTDASYFYSLITQNTSESLIIECTSDGIQAEIFGNKIALLPAKDPVKGDHWTSNLTINTPLSLGGALDNIPFTYTVTDVQTKTLFGKSRQEVTIDVTLDKLHAMTYSVLSGIGIENASIKIDLENFGIYAKEIKLQSAS